MFSSSRATSLCGDGNHPRLLGENPGERDLRGRRFLPSGDLAEQIHQGLIRSPVLRVKRGTMLRKSVLSNLFLRYLAREEPFS